MAIQLLPALNTAMQILFGISGVDMLTGNAISNTLGGLFRGDLADPDKVLQEQEAKQATEIKLAEGILASRDRTSSYGEAFTPAAENLMDQMALYDLEDIGELSRDIPTSKGLSTYVTDELEITPERLRRAMADRQGGIQALMPGTLPKE